MAWLVVVAQWGRQAVALESLSQNGFAPYCPKHKTTMWVHGQRTVKIGYLFGRYFFIKLIEKWKEAMGLRGVAGILMCGEEPSKVSDNVIKEIKSREGYDGYIKMEVLDKRVRYRKGQKVRMKRAHLFGIEGIFDRYYGGERVKILLNILNRRVVTIVRFDELSVI